MISRMLKFTIEKCINNATHTCYDKEAISDYVKDIQLDTWVINSKMNFTERFKFPSFRVSDFFFSSVLSESPILPVPRNYLYLRENTVETEDS